MCLCASRGLLWRAVFSTHAEPPRFSSFSWGGGSGGGGSAEGGLSATFLGVSTVLFSDGETSLLTDGFFSRPRIPVWIAPNPERIAAALERAQISRLAAVLVTHSHYDHALDAPEVARRTRALVVGSASTANLARGAGLPEAQIHTVTSGEALTFGRFRVTFVRSEHGQPLLFPGEIPKPMKMPAFVFSLKEGGSYSVLIEHPLGSVLVQSSAGFVPGALTGARADVVMLGVGELGRRDDAFREAYFQEVVKGLGARAVYPLHWDDFTRPLETAGVLSRATQEGLTWLEGRARAEPGLAHALLQPYQPVTLFSAARH